MCILRTRSALGDKFGPPGWQDDPEWRGWWGDDPPFHTPTYVLTHRPRPSMQMEGGTTFHFLDAAPADAQRHPTQATLAGGPVRMPIVPQADAPVALLMPPDIEDDALISALRRHYDLNVESPRSIDRVYLDTFDGRLHAAGLTLWRAAKPAVADVGLTLEEPGGMSRPVTARPTRRDRIRADDLAVGPIRDRLRAVIEERALVSQVRVRSLVRRIAVCNADGKTVARVAIERPTVVGPRPANASLSHRVHVTPVLGYPRAKTRVSKLLDAELGFMAAPAPLVAEAKAGAGIPVAGVSSKVDIELDPNMRADHASILICRRLADIVDANLPGTLADVDTEFLHDLRVAVRRTRSVLKEIKGIVPPTETERARADLRWIQEITGPTRDLDVQLEGWPTLVAAVNPSLADDLGPLHDLLTRHRAAAFALMRRRLKGQRYDRAWSAWRELLERPLSVHEDDTIASSPVRETAGRRVVSVYRAIVRHGSAIDDSSEPAALHDLRKRGKELRYLLELFGGLWPEDTVRPLVSTLKGLQDVLGRFQDDEIQIHHLRQVGPELAAQPGGTDSLIALGLVVDGLAADQRQARQAFAKRFASFAARPTRKLVTAAFGAEADA
jgi:CHAD domain-containing protein